MRKAFFIKQITVHNSSALMSHHSKPPVPYCLNCHYPISEFDKNCSQCGQKPTDGKTSLHDLFHEFVHTLFHLDGKFFWTLKHLFVPGKLTLEFFKGHHKRYAHPVQLFLVLGALCFGIVSSMVSDAERKMATENEKGRFNFEKKKMLKRLDSLSQTLSPQYGGTKTQAAFDSLMLTAYKKEFPEEIVDSNGATISLKVEDSVAYNVGKTFGRELAKSLSTKSNNQDTVKREEDIEIKVEKPSGLLAQFKEGVDSSRRRFEQEKKRKMAQLKTRKTFKDYAEFDDSLRLYPGCAQRITRSEMYSTDVDTLIKKYEVKGWFSQTMTKQNFKMRKEGQNLFHYIITKLLWFTLFMIPALALVLLVLYRRQKRFYVEHFVFLLHYNTFTFASSIIALPLLYKDIMTDSVATIYFLAQLIFPFLALKWYYKQGWLKTFLKYSIFSFMYLILSLVFTVLFLMLTFLFF